MKSPSVAMLCTSVLGLGCAIVGANASAQAFPNKPIKMVVPFAAGGLDNIVRAFTPGVVADLGQQIVIENRPGAGGTVGANVVAKAPPDGYTLLVSDPGATVNAIGLMKEMPYDPVKELTGVAMLLKAGMMLVVGPAAKFSNLKEMVDHVKANPGAVVFGDSGAGSQHHLSLELFKLRSGLDFRIVHYKGAGASVPDALGGQIDGVVVGANSIVGQIKSGKLRPIGVTSRARLSLFPEVPSLADAAPKYDAPTWTGVWAPAGTPRDILLKLNAAISKSIRSPEVVKRFAELGVDAHAASLDETNQFWQAELAIWPDLIRRLGLTSQ